MAVTLTTQPDSIMLTGNPIAYELTSDLVGANLVLLIRLEVESEFGMLDFTEIGQFRKVADSNKTAVFRIEALLASVMSYQTPDPAASTLQEGRQQCKRYRIQYADSDDDTAPVYSQSDDRFALKAAWNAQTFPNRSTVLPTQNQLLSTRPTTKRAFLIGQFEWMWLLPDTAGEEIDLEIEVTYIDGSTDSITPVNYGTTQLYLPIAIPLHDSLHNYSGLVPGKEIASINFRALGETINTAPNFEGFAFQRELLYINSLGGYDSLITYGQGQRSEEVVKDEAELFLPFNYTANSRQFATFNVQTQATERLSSGYRTKAERDAALDIIRSNEIYLRNEDAYIPINILGQSITNEQDGDYRYKLDFEFSYAKLENGLLL